MATKTSSKEKSRWGQEIVVQAVWEGLVLGKGRGRSKKQAETAAAEEAMQLKRWKKAKRRA